MSYGKWKTTMILATCLSMVMSEQAHHIHITTFRCKCKEFIPGFSLKCWFRQFDTVTADIQVTFSFYKGHLGIQVPQMAPCLLLLSDRQHKQSSHGTSVLSFFDKQNGIQRTGIPFVLCFVYSNVFRLGPILSSRWVSVNDFAVYNRNDCL